MGDFSSSLKSSVHSKFPVICIYCEQVLLNLFSRKCSLCSLKPVPVEECVLQDAESETTKSFPLQEQSVYNTVELQVGIKLVLFLVNY